MDDPTTPGVWESGLVGAPEGGPSPRALRRAEFAEELSHVTSPAQVGSYVRWGAIAVLAAAVVVVAIGLVVAYLVFA
jgi:hypothetical protein